MGYLLVCTKAIGGVQVLHTAHTLLMERISVRGGVEVQISSENFVASFTTEDHLDTHSLDFTAEEVHGCARANGGNIVRLEMVNNFRDGIQTFLNCEDIFVMNRAQEMCGLSRREEIRGVLETD